jgi:DNA gyrase/topoisomerase IV subunit A
MDQNLPLLYKEYGQYSNWRNFPSDIDGLKPVERRVLLSAYKIARNKLVKSRQVDAYTIGHYHPHGECYGTIVQLVRQGFLLGQGNFGTNVGVEPVGPAAPRYTECKIQNKTIDLAFKYIEHAIWVNTEFDDKEPLFLPTMFPFCLIGNDYTQGIGFGFKTYIPCYTVIDLYKRLSWLLGIRKTKPTIAPLTDCTIKSDNKVLEKLLTTGKAKIEVEGVIDIDKTKNVAILRSWPPGKRFESFLNKFATELRDGAIGFTDLSVNQTEIVFQVIRERRRDQIFNEFVEKLVEAVQGAISFETVVVDPENKVLTKPIDKMLMETFEVYTEVNKRMLNHQLQQTNDKIKEYKLLELIRIPLTESISKGDTLDNSVKYIMKQTKIPEKVILGLIDKYKIRKLITISTDTSSLEDKIIELQNTIKNIGDFVMEQYNEFIK